MARTTIKVEFNRFPEIAAKLPIETKAAVDKAAENVEQVARVFVPVDTGTLKASIHTEHEAGGFVANVMAGDATTPFGKIKRDGTVSTSKTPSRKYAVYQEFGTRRMAAQPYMTPAAEATRPIFERNMKRLLQDL